MDECHTASLGGVPCKFLFWIGIGLEFLGQVRGWDAKLMQLATLDKGSEHLD